MKITSGISIHDGLGVLVREIEPVSEEQRPDKGQLLEFLERNGLLEQLPLGLHREELVDELFRVGEEVMVVVLVSENIKTTATVMNINQYSNGSQQPRQYSAPMNFFSYQTLGLVCT